LAPVGRGAKTGRGEEEVVATGRSELAESLLRQTPGLPSPLEAKRCLAVKVATAMQGLTLSPGESLWEHGEESRAFYHLCTGELEAENEAGIAALTTPGLGPAAVAGSGGRQQPGSIYTGGSVVGLPGFLQRTRRSDNLIVALGGEATVLVMRQGAWEALREENGEEPLLLMMSFALSQAFFDTSRLL